MTARRSSPSPAPTQLPEDNLPWESLLTIRRCFAYNVPTREGHLSYYCEAWGLDSPIFTGELHVLAKAHYLHLRLILEGATFADSIWLDCATAGKPVPLESFIEGARDSSRYFVIRVGDGGVKPKRVVPIGVGFRERSQAFDLMAAIRDRIALVQRLGGVEDDMNKLGIDDAKEIEAAEAKLASYSQDLSLKAGVRIKVPVKGKTKQTGAAEVGGDDNSDGEGGGGGGGGGEGSGVAAGGKKTEAIALVQKGGSLLLAPPPDVESTVVEAKERKKKKKAKKYAADAAPTAAAAEEDDFGDFTSA